jgi:hypothetical protein
MMTFFAILIVVGGLCIAADVAPPSDSVPTELSNLSGIGAVMVAVGIMGEVCLCL